MCYLCNVINVETNLICLFNTAYQVMTFAPEDVCSCILIMFKYRENHLRIFLSGFCLTSSFSHAASNATTLWSWLLSLSPFLLSVFSLKREWRRMREERSWVDSLWRAFLCGFDFFRTGSTQYTYTQNNSHTDAHSFSRFMGHLHNF